MLLAYPAIFHEEDGNYWVEFPDLDGCHTYGSSIPETMEAAQEALSAYLLTLLEQGNSLAVPSDISALHSNDGFVSLVSCNISEFYSEENMSRLRAVIRSVEAGECTLKKHDLFCSESNMAHLREAVAQLDAGLGTEHELIEDEDDADAPNAETVEAIQEIERMKADPVLGKIYTDVDQMMEELLSDM